MYNKKHIDTIIYLTIPYWWSFKFFPNFCYYELYYNLAVKCQHMTFYEHARGKPFSRGVNRRKNCQVEGMPIFHFNTAKFSPQRCPCTLPPAVYLPTLDIIKLYLWLKKYLLVSICIFMSIHEVEQIFMFNGSLTSSYANYSCEAII